MSQKPCGICGNKTESSAIVTYCVACVVTQTPNKLMGMCDSWHYGEYNG